MSSEIFENCEVRVSIEDVEEVDYIALSLEVVIVILWAQWWC